jgi:hypothetical protein
VSFPRHFCFTDKAVKYLNNNVAPSPIWLSTKSSVDVLVFAFSSLAQRRRPSILYRPIVVVVKRQLCQSLNVELVLMNRCASTPSLYSNTVDPRCHARKQIHKCKLSLDTMRLFPIKAKPLEPLHSEQQDHENGHHHHEVCWLGKEGATAMWPVTNSCPLSVSHDS